MKKTALCQTHHDLGAKMAPFAGYEMPLFYQEGAVAEHQHVRSKAGLFDVSHMGQAFLEGEGAAAFLSTITPSNFEKTPHGRAKYTVITTEEGGIVDDFIATRLTDNKFFIVYNAGCKEKDEAWIEKHLPENVIFTKLNNRSLIALQGPKAEAVLSQFLGDAALAELPYMVIKMGSYKQQDIFISRLGYTGEDGFEISVHNDMAASFWLGLLENDAVKPIGLAARDSLRLEMGYPLYGHDIDETTSPIEAGLGWVVGKNHDGYHGALRIITEKENGTSRKRVGYKITGKGIAREGAKILDKQDKEIGAVTSGGYSPILSHAIGQGYVETSVAEEGNMIYIDIRGRKIEAEITGLSLVKAQTKSMKFKEAV